MADKSVFDSDKILGNGLFDLSRSKLVALAADICALAFKERGANGYRGGIRPDNISIVDSIVAIGPAEKANKDDCSKAELEYISPEFFWSGKAGSQSDVYSIGLLLYAGITGGKLPFVTDGSDDDRAQAFRKRMNGDKVKAPAGIGKKLGAIIEQATAFSATDRFKNTLELAEELKSLLVKADAEAVSRAAMEAFGKPESELSEIERMMLDIITNAALSDELADFPVEDPEEPEAEEVEEPEEADIEVEIEELPPEPEEPEEDSIEVEIEELPPEPEEPEEETIEVEIEELPPVEEKAEEPAIVIPPIEEPKEEPVKESPAVEAPVKEEPKPEEKSEEEAPIEVPAFVNAGAKEVTPVSSPKAEKKRPKPYIVVIALCVVLAIAALIYNSVSEKNDANAKQTLPPITYITPEPTATPEPDETAEPDETPEPEETEEPKEKVSSYQIFTENVSWDQAEQKCKELGGHLVAINDEEEYEKICELLSTVSAKYVWIGCYRSNAGILTWTNGEDIDYYNWAYKEPSLKDPSDGVAEDYIMLSRQSDGTWKYNDSRMDPMADYARFYSGNIAYICEIVE